MFPDSDTEGCALSHHIRIPGLSQLVSSSVSASIGYLVPKRGGILNPAPRMIELAPSVESLLHDEVITQMDDKHWQMMD